jgi:hypothetical protein
VGRLEEVRRIMERAFRRFSIKKKRDRIKAEIVAV